MLIKILIAGPCETFSFSRSAVMLASPKCPRAADAAVLSLGFRTMELIFRSSPGSVVVVVQSCPALCDPMDYSPPRLLSVHGTSQARRLELITLSFTKGSSRPRDRTHVSCVSCIDRWFFTTEPPGNPSLFSIHAQLATEEKCAYNP